MKKVHLLAGTRIRKISSVAFGFSSIKIHYSVNRINEVYVFMKKHLLHLYSIFWNGVTICFAAIELVIVLALSL